MNPEIGVLFHIVLALIVLIVLIKDLKKKRSIYISFYALLFNIFGIFFYLFLY